MALSREESILFHSNRFFIENGYDNTTMRQIAAAANVSLGLATYHFKSKRQIAVMIMSRYLEHLKGVLAPLLVEERDPLVHSAAVVDLAIEFFLSHPCRQFYLDCLSYDIYADAILQLGNQSMQNIVKSYHIGGSSDMLLLFDNYVPPAVEKILILEKEKGNFANTPYEEVPGIVFSVSVDRVIGREAIQNAILHGKVAARSALAMIPDNITETLFAE